MSSEFIKSIVEQAASEIADEVDKEIVKESVEEIDQPKEKLSLIDWIRSKIEEDPAGVITPNETFGENTPLPGFTEITLGIANVYGIKWGVIQLMQDWRDEAYQPHVVQTSEGLHFIRGFSRKEWMQLQKKIFEHTKNRMEAHSKEGTDQRWAQSEIEGNIEEMLVVAGSLDPKYSKETVRLIPSGLVSYLSQCITAASGYEANPLPPLHLK